MEAKWWWIVDHSLNPPSKSCYIICTARLGSPFHQHRPAKIATGFPIHAVSMHSHVCMACLGGWEFFCAFISLASMCDPFHVLKTPDYTKSGALENGYCVSVCFCHVCVRSFTYPLMTSSPFLLSLHGLNMTVAFWLDRRSYYSSLLGANWFWAEPCLLAPVPQSWSWVSRFSISIWKCSSQVQLMKYRGRTVPLETDYSFWIKTESCTTKAFFLTSLGMIKRPGRMGTEWLKRVCAVSGVSPVSLG